MFYTIAVVLVIRKEPSILKVAFQAKLVLIGPVICSVVCVLMNFITGVRNINDGVKGIQWENDFVCYAYLISLMAYDLIYGYSMLRLLNLVLI